MPTPKEQSAFDAWWYKNTAIGAYDYAKLAFEAGMAHAEGMLMERHRSLVKERTEHRSRFEVGGYVDGNPDDESVFSELASAIRRAREGENKD